MANFKQRINTLRWQLNCAYARHKFSGVFNYILSLVDLWFCFPFVLAKPMKIHISAIEGICNLSCATCPPFSPERRRELSLESFKKILDGLKHVFWINLGGWGEPFLIKDIFRIIEYAKSNNCHVYMVTNMTLVNEEMATKIVSSQLDFLGISFDAATKPLFERIRTGANFDAVIRNIKSLNAIKKSLGSKRPQLVFRVTAMKENIHEMPAIIERAYELGVSEVIINPLRIIRNTPLATENQSLTNYPELAEDFFSQAREKAKRLGIALTHPHYGKDRSRVVNWCLRPWVSLYLVMDGTIHPCCSYYPALGNIINDGLGSIWNSKKFRAIRKVVRKEGYLCYHCLKALKQLPL